MLVLPILFIVTFLRKKQLQVLIFQRPFSTKIIQIGINGPQSISSQQNEEIKNEEETLTNPSPIADVEEIPEEIREEEEKRETSFNQQNNLNTQQNIQQKHKRVEAIPILERHKRQQEKHSKQHSKHFVFPGSGKTSLQVTQQSNIGIPGEWLIRIDNPERVFLCGAGFKGLGQFRNFKNIFNK